MNASFLAVLVVGWFSLLTDGRYRSPRDNDVNRKHISQHLPIGLNRWINSRTLTATEVSSAKHDAQSTFANKNILKENHLGVDLSSKIKDTVENLRLIKLVNGLLRVCRELDNMQASDDTDENKRNELKEGHESSQKPTTRSQLLNKLFKQFEEEVEGTSTTPVPKQVSLIEDDAQNHNTDNDDAVTSHSIIKNKNGMNVQMSPVADSQKEEKQVPRIIDVDPEKTHKETTTSKQTESIATSGKGSLPGSTHYVSKSPSFDSKKSKIDMTLFRQLESTATIKNNLESANNSLKHPSVNLSKSEEDIISKHEFDRERTRSTTESTLKGLSSRHYNPAMANTLDNSQVISNSELEEGISEDEQILKVTRELLDFYQSRHKRSLVDELVSKDNVQARSVDEELLNLISNTCEHLKLKMIWLYEKPKASPEITP